MRESFRYRYVCIRLGEQRVGLQVAVGPPGALHWQSERVRPGERWFWFCGGFPLINVFTFQWRRWPIDHFKRVEMVECCSIDLSTTYDVTSESERDIVARPVRVSTHHDGVNSPTEKGQPNPGIASVPWRLWDKSSRDHPNRYDHSSIPIVCRLEPLTARGNRASRFQDGVPESGGPLGVD